MHALTVRLIDPLVITTVHRLLREAAAAAAAAKTITTTASATTATTTTTTATTLAGRMSVEMGDGCTQPISLSPLDLAITTVSPTLHPHRHPSVGLSLKAFETALVLNMRLLAHSPAASGACFHFPNLSHTTTIQHNTDEKKQLAI